MRIMIIVAHPDDETIGMGGTILKHVNDGDEVFLCIVTKSYTPDWTENETEEKRKETLEVSEALGIKETFFLEYPTVKLDTIPKKELNDKISKLIKEIRPEIVYTTHKGDINNDHKVVFESTMVATRPVNGCSVKRVLSFELLSSTEWGSETFVPNVYINIEDTLEEKIRIFSLYKTEVKEFPHPRSLKGISLQAEKRGCEIGLKAAEAFVLIKEIVC